MHHSAVRVNTRCLRRSVRPCGALGLPSRRRGYGDLGLHGPPGSDATMMQLIPLHGPHHHCACWHPDAPGSSRMHRVHHHLTQRAAPGRHRSCEGRAGPPHHWPRHASHLATSSSRCTPCIPAPADGCSRGRQLAVSHAARRRADAPRTWPPRIAVADRPTLLTWPCYAARETHTVITNPGVASRLPAPAEVFSMVRNPLPTSSEDGIPEILAEQRLARVSNDHAPCQGVPPGEDGFMVPLAPMT